MVWPICGGRKGVYQFIGLIFSIYYLFAKFSALRVNMLTCDELSCRGGRGDLNMKY